MRLRRALGFAAVLETAFLVPTGPASAQTITVTTTVDETSANGQTSLREALIWANANGQADTIQLPAGANHVIDFCAAGPLTHTAPHALTLQGGVGTSIQNTCAEMLTVVDTDGTAGLTLVNLEMTGFFVDESATLDGAAVSIENGGSLVLNSRSTGSPRGRAAPSSTAGTPEPAPPSRARRSGVTRAPGCRSPSAASR